MTVKTIATLAAISTLLAGCGGSGGSGGGTIAPPAAAASPGGIWTGTDSGTGMQVTALIAESGEMDVIRSDRAQFFGTISISGNSISATIEGDTAFGTAFPDGSIHGTGKVTGTLAEHSSIQATVAFTTDGGESTSSSVTLAFQSSYMTVPNIANLAGTYTDSNTGAVITINSGGTIFAQDPTSGCVVNGNIHVVDAAHSLYAPLADYASCTASAAPLNGLEFDGLATFSGSTALVGIHDKSGKHYGLVFSLSK
jgi:hypothetical protein